MREFILGITIAITGFTLGYNKGIKIGKREEVKALEAKNRSCMMTVNSVQAHCARKIYQITSMME